MRIAVNTRFLLPGRLEGFGWYTHEILRRMVVAHPEDEFIFLFDRDFDASYIYAQNVTGRSVFPPARHPILFYLWFEWAIPRVLKQCQADVFFSPDSFLSLSSKVPTVLTCHDLVPLHHPEQVERRHRKYLLRNIPRFLRRAEQVITVSQYVADDIVKTAGIEPAKIKVIYNGGREQFKALDFEAKKAVKSRFSNDKDYFLYAGAIHPRKNIPRLIRAFDLFKKASGSSVKLLLAGRFAWKTGDVTEAWQASTFADDIVFLGYVPDSDLADLYGAALALTYLSTSEGFGLPMLEAMCCDVPVLAANASCLPEIAAGAALLVDPFEENAIAHGMNDLFEKKALREELIEKGRRRREDFSWDRAAEQVYELLTQTFRS